MVKLACIREEGARPAPQEYMDNRTERGKVLLMYLEDLVLDVLREAKRNGEVLGPTDICRRAGIYLPEADQYYRDWVGSGIINALEAKGLVRRLDGGKRELNE